MMQSFNLLTQLIDAPGMDAIWNEDASINGWLAVEAAIARAQASQGLIPASAGEQIASAATKLTIDKGRLWEESRNVGYPILPIVRQLSEAVPAEAAGWVHYGATTQDIMDTTLAVQLRKSCRLLSTLVNAWGEAICAHAQLHLETVMPGRTHAQQAVPTTFGAKLGVLLAQVHAEALVLDTVTQEVSVVSLFGAGGTSAATGVGYARAVRAEVARLLGLGDADVPWHVARGGLARYGQSISTMCAVAIRFAREIIDLSRTEIAEVLEPGGDFRGASSTMPQKANPITSEQIIGLSVSAQASAMALLRAVEAGHERAAGEWQIEWQVLPQISGLAARALMLCTRLTEEIIVHPDRMVQNLKADGGLIMSEALMMSLVPLLGRGGAHDAVYRAAASARRNKTSVGDELARLIDLPDASSMSAAPNDYLGEAQLIVQKSVQNWNERRLK